MRSAHATNTSAMSTAIAMVKKEGIRTFFRGSTPALASAFIENTVVFAASGVFGRLLRPNEWTGAASFAVQCCQHAMSGFCSATAICAPEVIKVRLQNSRQPMSFAAAWDSCADLYRNQGARGFFRGIVPLWFRDVPFYVVFFGSYEAFSTICFQFLLPSDATDLSPIQAFFCGGLAGCVSWAIIFPCDVIKSRQQAGNNAPMGFVQTAKRLHAESGLNSFYRGVCPCLLRSFPANGALFVGVTTAHKLFRWYDNRWQ